MPGYDLGRYPGRLRRRFQPLGGNGHARGFLPALRAFSGLIAGGLRSAGTPQPLGRLGPLEVRLARRAAEVRCAQKIRYRVFYKEGSAVADPARVLMQRDIDIFDGVCDHLLVIDTRIGTSKGRGLSPVVGTYRLLGQEMAQRHGGFYAAGEFDIDNLVERHSRLRFLELGRSCVVPGYRNKRTVELLWQGIWSYVRQHGFDVMIGCASLDGTDAERLALPLSFLHHYASAPAPWHAQAIAQRRMEMNRLPKHKVDSKAAWRMLPPLLKGYLRLGAYVGDGAVIDRQFGTTDVLIVLPVAAISQRYVQYFSEDRARAA